MMMANYGFTHATFTSYDAGEQVVTDENGESQRVHVDYTGNRVPFAPAHTLGASADFTQPLNRGLWRSVTVGLNVSGCGDIYWNEQNSMRQKFYALMGAHVGGQLGSWLHFDFWAKTSPIHTTTCSALIPWTAASRSAACRLRPDST